MRTRVPSIGPWDTRTTGSRCKKTSRNDDDRGIAPRSGKVKAALPRRGGDRDPCLEEGRLETRGPGELTSPRGSDRRAVHHRLRPRLDDSYRPHRTLSAEVPPSPLGGGG